MITYVKILTKKFGMTFAKRSCRSARNLPERKRIDVPAKHQQLKSCTCMQNPPTHPSFRITLAPYIQILNHTASLFLEEFIYNKYYNAFGIGSYLQERSWINWQLHSTPKACYNALQIIEEYQKVLNPAGKSHWLIMHYKYCWKICILGLLYPKGLPTMITEEYQKVLNPNLTSNQPSLHLCTPNLTLDTWRTIIELLNFLDCQFFQDLCTMN